jgi:hypothetical protein
VARLAGRLALAAALLSAAAIPLVAQEARLVDRVVAVVDEDPILASDLERATRLGLVGREEGESEAAWRRRALDRLIEDRIRHHEVARFGFDTVPVAEVDRHLRSVRERFASPADYAAELARLGLDEDDLRQILARQLATLTFVEERLGPRIFVGVEEIRRYYDETLAPGVRAAGAEPPPIEDVRERVRGILAAQRLNEEIERWTAELRAEADVVDFLDPPERALPPVVETIEKKP